MAANVLVVGVSSAPGKPVGATNLYKQVNFWWLISTEMALRCNGLRHLCYLGGTVDEKRLEKVTSAGLVAVSLCATTACCESLCSLNSVRVVL